MKRTLNVSTAQEAFDAVRAHLATMTHRSSVHTEQGSVCVYRSADGGKCAFGALIPDEHYDPAMDDLTEFTNGCSAQHLIELFNIETSIAPQLLNELQYAHDNVLNWSNNRFDGDAELQKIARDFKLEWK